MTMNGLKKRLDILEDRNAQKRRTDTHAIERLYVKIRGVAERLPATEQANYDNMSIAEMCAINIDWSNPFSFTGVMRQAVDVRNKYSGDYGAYRTAMIKQFVCRNSSNVP